MKGQQEVISVVLISGILIGVVGSVYFWGVPLVQKNKDVALLENTESFIKSLDNKIKFVANNGGRDNIRIPALGIVRFDSTSSTIEITVNTEGTIYATEAAIPLGRNTACAATEGTFGINDQDTICVRSNKISDKNFRTIYTLSYVKLNDQEVLRSFNIKLTGPNRSGGQDNTIVFENKGNSESLDDQGRRVITTLIDINIA
ncbi:MAG: hypothetical protein NT120_01490 [Candidatus Aenigmarchaeota archaeon]|nr:hypothetical protein [Candidatus Aenigmarchaeota archaeon]